MHIYNQSQSVANWLIVTGFYKFVADILSNDPHFHLGESCIILDYTSQGNEGSVQESDVFLRLGLFPPKRMLKFNAQPKISPVEFFWSGEPWNQPTLLREPNGMTNALGDEIKPAVSEARCAIALLDPPREKREFISRLNTVTVIFSAY